MKIKILNLGEKNLKDIPEWFSCKIYKDDKEFPLMRVDL